MYKKMIETEIKLCYFIDDKSINGHIVALSSRCNYTKRVNERQTTIGECLSDTGQLGRKCTE